MTQPVRSIALVRLSAIGDVVHALPLLHSLRGRYPDARITWIIERGPRELIQGVEGVDEFVLFRRRPLIRGLVELRRTLGGRRFDLVLTPQPSVKAALVTALLRSPRKIGFDRGRSPEFGWLATRERIPARPVGHFADEMLEFADHLGAPRIERWGIGPTAAEEERWGSVLPADRPLIAFAVASSRREKDWPAQRFAELAERLVGQHGAGVVLIGGTGERENRVGADVVSRASVPIRDLRENDLRRLATIAAACDVVVGPDSAPLHIAAAVGTATVGLFGFTNPARYGSRGPGAVLVDAFHDPGEAPDPARSSRPGRMERISTDQVAAAIDDALRS